MTAKRSADREPRILITGATGFVGSRLMRRLQESKPKAPLLGLRGPGLQPTLTEFDLADAKLTAAAIANFQPSVVVHLAASASVGGARDDPRSVWAANFDATRALAEAVNQLDGPIRFVFASSAEVYGRAFNYGPCDEDTPIAPANAYARTKLSAECMLQDYISNKHGVIVLRLFNHTGPGQDERFVLPNFAAQIARLPPSSETNVIHVGNLEATRDFSDVDDIIDAYIAVIESEDFEPGFEIFNVGSSQQRSIRSLLDALIVFHGSPVFAQSDPARMRPSDIPVAAGRFEKFGHQFGWSPRRDFSQTICDVLAYEKARLHAQSGL